MMETRSLKDAETIVVHELLHAVAQGPLSDPNNRFAKRFDEIRKQVQHAVIAGPDEAAFKRFIDEVMTPPRDKRRPMTPEELHKFYPLVNSQEFFAGLFENRQFVEYLQTVKVKGSNKTMWQNVVEFLTQMISDISKTLGVQIAPDSIAYEAMEVALQIFPSADFALTTESAAQVEERRADQTDEFQYYGARYTILLRKAGDSVYPYDVKDYRGKDDKKQKLLSAYMNNPDVDPQNNKQFRNIPEPAPKQETPNTSSVTKIISGGQTGADRGGLEAGRRLGVETGGTAPLNYRTEKGSDHTLRDFGLDTDTSSDWKPRTIKNIQNSDATVVIGNASSPGSRLTVNTARQQGKPVLVLSGKDVNRDAQVLREFLDKNSVDVLNVAGNRESGNPGLQAATEQIVSKALSLPVQGQLDLAPKAPKTPNKYLLQGKYEANAQQREALDKLEAFFNGPDRVFVLVGRGGTGKTTVVSQILPMLSGKKVAGAAYSHAAAGELEKSIPDTMTVASLLGIKPDAITGSFTIDSWARRNGIPIERLDIIIVDETSMISKEMMQEMFKYMKPNAKIVFMGDNVQLPPISNNPADAIQSSTFNAYNGANNFAKLTTRMRSGETHPLVPISDLIAENVESDSPELRILKDSDRKTKMQGGIGVIFENDFEKTIDMYINDVKRMGESANPINWVRIVTFNNQNHSNVQSVGSLNRMIRTKIYGEERAAKERFIPGEIVVAYETYSSERAGYTKYSDVNNSQSFRVESVSEPKSYNINESMTVRGEYFSTVGTIMIQEVSMVDEKGNKYLVPVVASGYEADFRSFIKANTTEKKAPGGMYYRIMQHILPMEPAHAITSHKAQGQTFTNVYVMEDNITGNTNGGTVRAKNQSLYVAVTRASKKLVMHSRSNPSSNIEIKDLKPGVEVGTEAETKPDLSDIKGDSPFFMPMTADLGTTIDVFMKGMTKEQRAIFRDLRNEGFIVTKCQ
jgi:hypothetical protein